MWSLQANDEQYLLREHRAHMNRILCINIYYLFYSSSAGRLPVGQGCPPVNDALRMQVVDGADHVAHQSSRAILSEYETLHTMTQKDRREGMRAGEV